MIIQYGHPHKPTRIKWNDRGILNTAHLRIVPASLQEPMPGAQVEGAL